MSTEIIIGKTLVSQAWALAVMYSPAGFGAGLNVVITRRTGIKEDIKGTLEALFMAFGFGVLSSFIVAAYYEWSLLAPPDKLLDAAMMAGAAGGFPLFVWFKKMIERFIFKSVRGKP